MIAGSACRNIAATTSGEWTRWLILSTRVSISPPGIAPEPISEVEGATLTEEELCRWVAERVPYFAIPRYVEFRADLPRNPVGRVLKYQLREEGRTQHTWDREAAGVTFERR